MANLSELADALSDLIAGHVQLARAELREDAKFYGIRLGIVAALAPLILIGYGFLCAAVAMLLSRWLATDLSILIVGLLNLGVGGGGIYLVGQQLSKRAPMETTTHEIEDTTRALSAKGGPS